MSKARGRLLDAAGESEIRRTLVLSSMSAFIGTKQLYGRAKLDIEAMTVESGSCALRPGLVYSEHAGGMAGALRKLTRLPVVPVISGGAGLYMVDEDDLMDTIVALTTVESLAPEAISVAHPIPIELPDLLRILAERDGRRPRFVPIPWQMVYCLLRSAEVLRVRTPFRADSVLGLVHGLHPWATPDLSQVWASL